MFFNQTSSRFNNLFGIIFVHHIQLGFNFFISFSLLILCRLLCKYLSMAVHYIPLQNIASKTIIPNRFYIFNMFFFYFISHLIVYKYVRYMNTYVHMVQYEYNLFFHILLFCFKKYTSGIKLTSISSIRKIKSNF